MVHFSACLAVLLPFLALVVEPALLSPDREVVFSLYCFYYVLSFHMCFFILFSPPSTVGFYRLQLYGDFRRDERLGFLLDSASLLCTVSVAS